MSGMGDETFRTRTFELTTVGASQVISGMMRERGYGGQWNVKSHEPAIMDALVYTMTGFLASEHLKTVRIAYPRDWAEAVKARFAPAWLLRRWPVQEKVHTVDLKAVYPEMPVPEQCGRFIRVVEYTPPTAWGGAE